MLFDDAIKILILLNKKNRNTTQNLYSFSDYAQEYCTVKCDVGRQIGKSTYIKTHADDKSLVVMNNRMIKHFSIKNRKFDLCSPSDLLNNSHYLHKKKYETIYVDEPLSSQAGWFWYS